MSIAKDSSELLIVEEVAREMRTTVWAVRSWIRTGKLPALRPGKRLLVRRSDVIKMLTPVVVTRTDSRSQGPAQRARTP